MKLVQFSVTNYRSITAAHKIVLKDKTILVGKNNEGKSNLLNALNVAMSAVIRHGSLRVPKRDIYSKDLYEWERDFPIQFQQRKSGLESIFRLNFRLDEKEITELYKVTGIRGNEDIPIEIRIGKENKISVKVRKRGSPAYNQKSTQITEFVSSRITFNYIQAIRTENLAIHALQDIISDELKDLYYNAEYVNAQEKINHLEQEALDRISEKLIAPMRVFLPSINDVCIRKYNERPYARRRTPQFDVIINDGVATSISNKGDGIKSLVAIALLRERINVSGASVIAIEEPESHLHSGAIHSLVDIINNISENNQVIISTHNPLFVSQNEMTSNIIVDGGSAKIAKSISEIRNVLGVLPSDNLQNARYVLVVEGEDDRIALSKILSLYSKQVQSSLQNNTLVIKALGGASNLSHDLLELKNNMCRYVVLLDNDSAGKDAAEKAKENGLLKDSELRFTICNGMPEAEFEDCLQPSIYKGVIKEEFGLELKGKHFRSNKKWSERVRLVFLDQGVPWNSQIEKKVKSVVANSIPNNTNSVDSIVINEKSGFLKGIVTLIEEMISE